MNTPQCAICYDAENPSPLIHKWTCSHDEKFHTICIENWKGGCPLCRNKELLEQYKPIHRPIPRYSRGRRCISPEYLLNSHNHIPNQYKPVYMEQWIQKICIENNHHLIFIKPYGVVGWCQNCDITQCFNLSHSIN
tara:strand:+ start:3607 stop:4014 length:408 start_codon:yes stop_codon:yes gene_type:complete